jgi:hypothetical protein
MNSKSELVNEVLRYNQMFKHMRYRYSEPDYTYDGLMKESEGFLRFKITAYELRLKNLKLR